MMIHLHLINLFKPEASRDIAPMSIIFKLATNLIGFLPLV